MKPQSLALIVIIPKWNWSTSAHAFDKKKKTTRKYIRVGCGTAIAILLLIIACDITVSLKAHGRTYDDVAEIPYREYGLVLGTSPFWGNHYRNFYYENRITAAANLYHAHKVGKLIVSGGDYRDEQGYDEPVAMRDSLVAHGVSADAILLDSDGTRTLKSVANIREVYGVDNVTIISQEYHNERALCQADHLGVDAIAFNAVTPKRLPKLMTNRGRECLARVKLLFDLLIMDEPDYVDADKITPQKESQVQNIAIEEANGLVIYYPNYTKIDFTFETMPSPDDASVLMCCEAAFTGELLNEFKHSNIAGNHVSSGVLHKGYKAGANTGCFAYYADSGKWEFAQISSSSLLLENAVKHGGMAFCQTLILSNGKDVHNGRPCKDSSKNQYRALCELDSKLCIIDAKETMSYGDFIQALLKTRVKHALYLDIGSGWNYSFYRNNDNKVRYIHNHSIKYTTNWITFYKRATVK